MTDDGFVRATLDVEDFHLAPNGFLHGGTVVALADTACGYGCVRALPSDAVGFATIELKTNFLGTSRSGSIVCEARLVHGGKTTQVWDATVTADGGETIAMFRCTQMVLQRSGPASRLPSSEDGHQDVQEGGSG